MRSLIQGYVNLNAYNIKTGPCKEALAFSSHRFYVEGDEPPVAKPFIQAVLQCFSGDLSKARMLYDQFAVDGLRNKNWKSFYKLKESYFLGGDKFIADLRAKTGSPVPPSRRPSKQNLPQLLNAVVVQSGVSFEAILSVSKAPRVAQARRTFVQAARFLWQTSGKELAGHLQKDPSAISQMIRGSEKHSAALLDALLESFLLPLV